MKNLEHYLRNELWARRQASILPEKQVASFLDGGDTKNTDGARYQVKDYVDHESKTRNEIILDECSTVVEIDHVRNRKTAQKGKMNDIWLEFLRL